MSDNNQTNNALINIFNNRIDRISSLLDLIGNELNNALSCDNHPRKKDIAISHARDNLIALCANVSVLKDFSPLLSSILYPPPPDAAPSRPSLPRSLDC